MLGAEVIGDGVEGSVHPGNVDVRVLVRDAVLDVEALDFNERTGGGVVVSDELGDDGHGLGGVEGHAGAEESGVAHTVRVEIASVGVANARVPIGISTFVARAGGWAGNRARMRSVRGGDGVGFPEVHLIAARA